MPKSGINEKVAVITGTSTGIGLSTAVLLAKAGYTVVATMRNPEKATALRERADAEGVKLDVRTLDVCSDSSVKAAVDSVIETYGRIDTLVNNAGAAFLATLEQLSMADLQRTMDVNFYGVVRTTNAVLPHMRKAKSGRIISVSSVGGVVGQPFNDAYCAAKFAVEGLMESFAPVARKLGLDVILIEPGAVASEFVATAMATENPKVGGADDPYESILKPYLERSKSSFSMAQKPDDVARIIVEAATISSPAFRYTTSDWARKFVSVKSADPDGSAVLAMTSSWL